MPYRLPKSIQIARFFTELFKKQKSGSFCNALQYTLLCCNKFFCDYLEKYHKVAQIVAILSSNCAECREPADRDHRECCRCCCLYRRRYCHRSHRLQVSLVIYDVHCPSVCLTLNIGHSFAAVTRPAGHIDRLLHGAQQRRRMRAVPRCQRTY